MEITKQYVLDYINNNNALNELSNKEKEKLADIAVAYQLNPIKKEIYFTINNSNVNWQWVKTWTPIVAYTSILAIANKQVKWFRFEWLWDSKDVKIIVDTIAWWQIEWEVYFDEFAKKKRDGTLNSMWANMGKFMIRKVALAQAMRFIAPNELSWLYIAEEITEHSENQITWRKEVFRKHEFKQLADSFNDWWLELWKQTYVEMAQSYNMVWLEDKIKKLADIYKENQKVSEDDINNLWKNKEDFEADVKWNNNK